MEHHVWRQALLQHKAAIGVRILTLRGQAGTNGTGRGSDQGENAVDSNNEGERMRTLESLYRIDRAIDYLLNTKDEKTFNVCEECGEEIMPARLRALLDRPTGITSLRKCVDCVSAREAVARNHHSLVTNQVQRSY